MNPSGPPRLSRGCYTIGWICPLAIELTAAISMLDEIHQPLPQSPGDSNTYVLGSIDSHDVVLACLPEMGTTPAATTARQMKLSFPDLRCALLVGIGGGIPSEQHDIRVGDVVVGVPGGEYGAVVQWDYGKTAAEGRFVHRGTLNDPPALLLTALNTLRAQNEFDQMYWSRHIDSGLQRLSPDRQRYFKRPSTQQDYLFASDHDHVDVVELTCVSCDNKKLVSRADRPNRSVSHFGTIASGNQVIKYGQKRDEIGNRFNALCLEMEAAGIVKDLPSIVIRGICDYSDSHKNKVWQPYAALAAAAFAKGLLSVLPSERVNASLDPGYLFYSNGAALRLVPMGLRDLGRDEMGYPGQGYWHELTVLRAEDARASDRSQELQDQHRQLRESIQESSARNTDAPADNEPAEESMEVKLADFMQEYHSTMHDQLDDFPLASQRSAVFGAMLRMTRGSVDRDLETGRTLLHYMAMNGVSNVLSRLVQLGFTVDDGDSDAQTPLHLAVLGGHWEATRVLIEECHASVHFKDYNGLLPWHHALRLDTDNLADNEQRQEARQSIIKLLASVTDLSLVRGAYAHKALVKIKANPNTEILI